MNEAGYTRQWIAPSLGVRGWHRQFKRWQSRSLAHHLAAFAATAAGYMGIPFTGTAAIGAAAVLASQGQLNIAAVLIVAAMGNEVGGLLGFQVGDRWAGKLLEHPVPALKMRKKAAAKREEVCKKWGRAAVPLSRVRRGLGMTDPQA